MNVETAEESQPPQGQHSHVDLSPLFLLGAISFIPYPFGLWEILKVECDIIVTNIVLLAMSLPQFLLWISLIGAWIWLGIKDSRKPFFKDWFWRVLLLGPAWLASVAILLLGSVFLDLWFVSMRESKAIQFDQEPWKTRVVEAAEYDRTHPGDPMKVEYPVPADIIDIGLALQAAIDPGDSKEDVEEFLKKLRVFEQDGWTVYAIPIGYFRYLKVILVKYQDGKVDSVRIPYYFSNSFT